MKEQERMIQERNHMVENQIKKRGIHDPQVLEAMLSVPRHIFVPAEYQEMAYSDGPLPIGLGQTISQPYIVALMTQLLQLKGTEIVLEIGTGSGYQSAILAQIAAKVHTIERHPSLAQHAAQLFKDLGFLNIEVQNGDGSIGLVSAAPFDAILVTAAAPGVPQTLLDQLSPGGRMVLPVGGRYEQSLERWVREGNQFSHESIAPVAFVPLIGESGWKE
jgi:protein-L-isoaspartate(D-aspartate) O-methyltransferase